MFPRVLLLVVETPAVFLLPLLLTTVAVLDGFISGFVLTLAFVSTTPLRVALLLLLLFVVPVFVVFVLSLPQPAPIPIRASRHKEAIVRRMDPPFSKKIAA
jgi:predicted permease